MIIVCGYKSTAKLILVLLSILVLSSCAKSADKEKTMIFNGREVVIDGYIPPDHGGEAAMLKMGDQNLSSVPDDVGDFVVDANQADFDVINYADNLDFLTCHERLPDGRMVIGEKAGRVLIRELDGSFKVAGQLKADTTGARGLLNIILHPQFETNRRLLFYYSVANVDNKDRQRVSSIPLDSKDQLDLTKEIIIVRGLHGAEGYEQGGGLLIGGDGKLYVGVGDGGWRAGKPAEPAYEPSNYFATCLSNGNGKILRVNLDGSIPADNPLVGVKKVAACGDDGGVDPKSLAKVEPRKDIWIWGVRNPWRMWSDPKTGYMWFIDDGDITHEEVNVIKHGNSHFGWPWREGAAGHPINTCRNNDPLSGDCIDPAYYCKHGESENGVDGGCQSMGGGLGVDDTRWPQEHRGRFFFGDCSNGWIWSLAMTESRDGIKPGSRLEFGRVGGLIVDMDMDADGGMYVGVLELPPQKSRIVKFVPKRR